MRKLDESEILDFLGQVESGAIKLSIVGRPWGYCGVEVFRASNGWEIAIFNDCGEWDYIEWITAPCADFTCDDMWPEGLATRPMPTLDCWEPTNLDVWEQALVVEGARSQPPRIEL